MRFDPPIFMPIVTVGIYIHPKKSSKGIQPCIFTTLPAQFFFENHLYHFQAQTFTTVYNTWKIGPIRPRKLAWNLKMDPSNRRFLLESTIFRFYVKFRGSTRYYPPSISHLFRNGQFHQNLRRQMNGGLQRCLQLDERIAFLATFQLLGEPRSWEGVEVGENYNLRVWQFGE